MTLVLDSSTALAWIYREETTEALVYAFDLVSDSGAWVPALWRLEVANILEMGVRKGRNNALFRDGALADLSMLPISLDPETDRHAWGATARIASRHRLTVYDAAYFGIGLTTRAATRHPGSGTSRGCLSRKRRTSRSQRVGLGIRAWAQRISILAR